MTTGRLKAVPCHLRFTAPGQQKQTGVYGRGVVSVTDDDTCAAYATIHYVDYGLWLVTAKSKAGKCSTLFTGYNAKNKAVGTATVVIKNEF